MTSAFVPSMQKISNRSFIERLKEWGWTVTKTSGEKTTMRHLNLMYRIEVRSAHIRQGNSHDVIQKILDLMDMSWNEFMTYDVDAGVQRVSLERVIKNGLDKYEATREITPVVGALADNLLDSLMADAYVEDAKRTARKIRHAQEAEARRQRKVARMIPVPEPITIDLSSGPLTDDEQDAFNEVAARINRPDDPERRTMINRAFDALVESGEPMSAGRLADCIGITAKQATGVLVGLTRHKVAERVKPGVYRATRDQQTGTTLHHSVSSPVPVVPVTPLTSPTYVLPTPPQAVPSYGYVGAADQPLTEAVEDTINDVLDLMFPNGMRIKAADIRLLDQWRVLTAEVIRRVGG